MSPSQAVTQSFPAPTVSVSIFATTGSPLQRLTVRLILGTKVHSHAIPGEGRPQKGAQSVLSLSYRAPRHVRTQIFPAQQVPLEVSLFPSKALHIAMACTQLNTVSVSIGQSHNQQVLSQSYCCHRYSLDGTQPLLPQYRCMYISTNRHTACPFTTRETS
jgi:hypothetical protein